MPDVRMPDGTIMRNVPAGTPKQEIIRRYRKSQARQSMQPGAFQQAAEQALSLGLSDEIAGAAGFVSNAVVGGAKALVTGDASKFDPVAAYRRERDAERANIDRMRQERPVASTLGDIAGIVGSVATTPFRAGQAGATTLRSIVARSAKAGAVTGGAAGFGYGRGAEESVAGTVGGAALGGAIGAAVPVAVRLASAPVRAARRILSRDPGLGREAVAEALAADGLTGRAAGQAMDQARTRGVPAMLADQGDNLRGLAGSVSRKPGPSRALMRDAVIERQMAQGERVRGAVARDLGEIADPAQVSDDLMRGAQARAAPLYSEAYSAPARTSEELQAILQTPAGRQAMTRARTIAANERRDPSALGFDLDDQGEVILRRDASLQTLDYVKRGLDDILEEGRDKVTGRLRLDEAGRAINQVRAQLVNELDRLNPVYRAARQAYQGPARENEALQLGRKALRMSPEEIARATGRFSESERAQFALGYRAALADTIDNRIDGADKVGALVGTPKKRAALARAFGGRANFDRFMATLADERAGNETYRTVTGGSPTARFLADDALTEDSALFEQALGDRVVRGAQGGWAGMLTEALGAIKDASKFGVGEAGQRARQEAAAILSETDPALLQEALRRALADRSGRQAATASAAGRQVRASQVGGQLSGSYVHSAGQPSK